MTDSCKHCEKEGVYWTVAGDAVCDYCLEEHDYEPCEMCCEYDQHGQLNWTEYGKGPYCVNCIDEAQDQEYEDDMLAEEEWDADDQEEE